MATVRPVSKPLAFDPDLPTGRTLWWCSDCRERVEGPWHECEVTR